MTILPPTPLQLALAHPLDERPYNLLRYVRTDAAGTHLYRVYNENGDVLMFEAGPYVALGEAQKAHPAGCWYCESSDQPFKWHRDHVIASVKGAKALATPARARTGSLSLPSRFTSALLCASSSGKAL